MRPSEATSLMLDTAGFHLAIAVAVVVVVAVVVAAVVVGIVLPYTSHARRGLGVSCMSVGCWPVTVGCRWRG